MDNSHAINRPDYIYTSFISSRREVSDVHRSGVRYPGCQIQFMHQELLPSMHENGAFVQLEKCPRVAQRVDLPLQYIFNCVVIYRYSHRVDLAKIH